MIYIGDCLEIMPTLEAESVDCCVTSPPYYGLRDYGVSGQIGIEKTPEDYVAKMVAVFREVRRVLRKSGTCWLVLGDTYATGAGKVGNCPGGGSQEEAFKSHFGKHSPGSLLGMSGKTQPNRMPLPGFKRKDLIGIPWRVAFALQADGWWLRQDIIWHKPNCMIESVTDRCTRAHAYIFLLTKSARYFYDAEAIKEPQSKNERNRRLREQKQGLKTQYNLKRDAVPNGQHPQGANGAARTVQARHRLAKSGTRNCRSVWMINNKPYKKGHFATFPPEIPERCIKAGCPVGGTIIDPFSGTGMTGIVAERLERKHICIELNPAYPVLRKQEGKSET